MTKLTKKAGIIHHAVVGAMSAYGAGDWYQQGSMRSSHQAVRTADQSPTIHIDRTVSLECGVNKAAECWSSEPVFRFLFGSERRRPHPGLP